MKSKTKGLISAILPTYNRANWLEERFQDLLTQSYENWELIIVNDASTDNTKEIVENFIKEYPDKVKLINLPFNSSSVSIPRNIGITHSNGEFIAPLDDDVQNFEFKFRVLVDLLNSNPNAVLAYGDRIDFNLKTKNQITQQKPNWNPLKPLGYGVDNGQFIYRSNVYDKIPLQFPKRACDWELAKLIKPLGDFVYFDSPVCVYFWHDKNRSLDNSTKTKEIFPEKFKEFLDRNGYKIQYN